VLLAIATVWAHYVFAVALVPIAVYGYARSTQGCVRPARLTAAWGAVALGLAPLGAQLISLASRAEALSVPAEASIEALLFVLVPPVLAGGLVLGLLLARLLGPVSFSPRPSKTHAMLLLGGWLVVPPVMLVAVSMAADVSLYSPRYYLSAAPPAACLFGWLLSGVGPDSARRAVVIVFAVLAVIAAGGRLKNSEDWRGAAGAERPVATEKTLVFLHAALVESAQVDWLDEPERASYLNSPASFYGFDGRLVPLPYLLDGEDAFGYLERITSEEIGHRDRFLLVSRYPFVPYKEWWAGRLAPLGWRYEVLGSFGVVELVEFTRGGDAL
jgi:hypothetical protein